MSLSYSQHFICKPSRNKHASVHMVSDVHFKCASDRIQDNLPKAYPCGYSLSILFLMIYSLLHSTHSRCKHSPFLEGR